MKKTYLINVGMFFLCFLIASNSASPQSNKIIKANFTAKIVSHNVQKYYAGNLIYRQKNQQLKFELEHIVAEKKIDLHDIDIFKPDIFPKFNFFELILHNQLNYLGLNNTFAQLDSLYKENGFVFSVWNFPENSKYSRILMQNGENLQLNAVAFYNKENKLKYQFFFKKYIEIENQLIPTEIISIYHVSNDEKIHQKVTLYFIHLGFEHKNPQDTLYLFAQYLYDRNLYKQAAKEFRKLSANSGCLPYSEVMFLRSLRKFNSDENHFPKHLHQYPEIESEYLKLLYVRDLQELFQAKLEGSVLLTKPEKKFHRSIMLLNDFNFIDAKALCLESEQPMIYRDSVMLFIKKNKQTKLKNRALAAGFSAFIPGAGQLYGNDWANAVISLLSVGTAAFQTYRAFRNYGNRDPLPFVFLGITAGLHLKNIVGASKQIKHYNEKLKADYRKKLDNLYFIDE